MTPKPITEAAYAAATARAIAASTGRRYRRQPAPDRAPSVGVRAALARELLALADAREAHPPGSAAWHEADLALYTAIAAAGRSEP